MLSSLVPCAFEHVPIVVYILPATIHHVITESACINVAVRELQYAHAVFFAFVPLALVFCPRSKHILSIPTDHVLDKLTIVELAVGIVVHPKAVFLVVLHLPFIHISIVVSYSKVVGFALNRFLADLEVIILWFWLFQFCLGFHRLLLFHLFS